MFRELHPTRARAGTGYRRCITRLKQKEKSTHTPCACEKYNHTRRRALPRQGYRAQPSTPHSLFHKSERDSKPAEFPGNKPRATRRTLNPGSWNSRTDPGSVQLEQPPTTGVIPHSPIRAQCPFPSPSPFSRGRPVLTAYNLTTHMIRTPPSPSSLPQALSWKSGTPRKVIADLQSHGLTSSVSCG